MSAPTAIPALLYVNTSGKATRFCINFHGNACDIGQIALCAEKEGRAFNAHYMLVEYPRFGISDGHPNEVTLNRVAKSVFDFVTREFKISPSEVVLLGRSIGTGPACELASQLQVAGTPPAALILQSPYSSLRDVTYDILGCVNFFLLDRWQSWRRLIGHEEDASVIRCPVLFIHADGDRVINCQHSMLMHEYRLKCGLKSELFIQKSDAVFVKGHNYFDYDRDVLLPSADFLARHVNHNTLPGSTQNGNYGINGGNTTTNGMHNSSLETHSRLIILPKDLIRQLTVIPPSYENTYTQAREMDFLGSKSLFKSPKCTWDVYAGWCCCPCVSCTECCVACNYNTATFLWESLPGCAPLFSYRSLRPADDPNRSTLWDVLVRPTEFKKNIREHEAAASAGQRQQRHVFHQQQFHRTVLRNNSSSNLGLSNNTTTNPLLAGSMMGDKQSVNSSNTSAVSRARNSSFDYSSSVLRSSLDVSGTNGQDGSSSPTTGDALLQAVEDGHVGLDYLPG